MKLFGADTNSRMIQKISDWFGMNFNLKFLPGYTWFKLIIGIFNSSWIRLVEPVEYVKSIQKDSKFFGQNIIIQNSFFALSSCLLIALAKISDRKNSIFLYLNQTFLLLSNSKSDQRSTTYPKISEVELKISIRSNPRAKQRCQSVWSQG